MPIPSFRVDDKVAVVTGAGSGLGQAFAQGLAHYGADVVITELPGKETAAEETAALVRAMKVMAADMPGGTSFMEDYTYHLHPDGRLVLGAHMLEICPSIAADKPALEVHPLGIGGKEDPLRLVFNAHAGAAINAAMMDLGNRFRLLVNEVDVIAPPQPLPKLPVARAVWQPRPNFKTACAAWIYAGGAHHTGFSYSVTSEHMEDFAEMAGIELVVIDKDTTLREFKQTLRNNEVYYHLAPGLGRM